MAFVVEDGSGKSDANAYVSVAEVTSYLTESGQETAWNGLASDTVREQHIVIATRYVDSRFGAKFLGSRRNQTQALEWPREEVYFGSQLVYNAGDIPKELKWAIAEYANLHITKKLNAVPSSSRDVDSESVGVGSIRRSRKFSKARRSGGRFTPDGSHPSLPVADELIAKLLGSASEAELSRA